MIRSGFYALRSGVQLALLHKRMKFDLVNYWRYAGFIHQPLEMIDLKVAHAYALNQTFFLQVDHVFPRFNVVVDRRNRPVHQVQIEVIKLEFFHAFEQGFPGAFLVIIPQLGGDE